ncbi:hypothetical protein uvFWCGRAMDCOMC403_030 [Freshwater phage uvFW-CGR-AMD-COM-C403]|nr:hypothetical protein uvFWCGRAMDCOMC403_030 [Freshwater phage uvFW-CGR-AMD-COM-C403]
MLNWQEDENAPRGTRYYVGVEGLRLESNVNFEVDGTSWQDAMAKAIEKLQEIGEI